MSKDHSEKRRAQRRPILSTFSFFVVAPSKGIHRLAIHDISTLGIGFDFDSLGGGEDMSIQSGDDLEIHLYLNQSLFIPLQIHVVRAVEGDHVKKIGAEFSDTSTKSYQALVTLCEMLDQLDDAAHISGP